MLGGIFLWETQFLRGSFWPRPVQIAGFFRLRGATGRHGFLIALQPKRDTALL